MQAIDANVAADGHPVALIPINVLIVDDSADDTLLLAGALIQGGFEPQVERVDSASGMALALARRTWHVVLCEPQLRGFDIRSALALLDTSRLDIPFIAVSNETDDERTTEIMRSGAHDRVSKGALFRLAPAVKRELISAATRRREAETMAALERSNERLLSFAANLPGLVYQRVRNADGSIIYPFIGGNFLNTLGIDPAEAGAGTIDLWRWLHPDDLAPWQAAIERSAADLAPLSYELRLVLPTGEIRWISSLSRPREEEDGRIVWDVVAIDTTDRHLAEQALERSRQRFQDIAELASDWIWECDADHRLTFLSGGATAELWIDGGSAIGDVLWALPGPPDIEVHSIPPEVAQCAPIRNHRIELLGSDGSPRHFLISGKPMFAAGAFVGYRGVARNVTATTLAEAKRAEAENSLRDAIDSISEGFVIYDSDDRLVMANAKYAELYQRSVRDDEIGVTFEELIRRGVRAGEYPQAAGREEDWIQERLRQHRNPGTPIEQQLDGGRWLLITEQRMKSGGIAGLRMDITLRKKAEEALRQSEEKHRRVIDVLPTAIIVHVGGEVVFANSAAARLAGATNTDELLGKSVLEFVRPDQREAAAENIRAAVEGRTQEGGPPIERTILRLDGATRSVELMGIPLTYAGKPGVLVAIQDVTEKRAAEREREELRQRDQQSQRMQSLGQLTGGIAHDFNNLLQIMLGNLELAREGGAGNAAGAGQLDAALAAGLRGADLIRRLLSFARQQPLVPTAVDLKQRISGLIPLLSRALGESIEVKSAHAEDLWPVVADPGQFDNAILNLAINARDAMPDGGWLNIDTANVVVDAAYAAKRPGLRSSDYVKVAMTDCGCGMAPEVVERVFEPFYTTKQVGKGTGLGLSMIYGFVRQSGGHVSIDSEVGLGTTVTILLPRSLAEAEPQGDRGSASELPTKPTETILVVEDDVDVRVLTLAFLEDLGYRTLEAGTAAEGMEIIAASRDIDMLLTDVVLPGGSGVHLAERARIARPSMKVLFMSGYTREAMMHKGRLEAGVVLLQKPFGKRQLAERVRAILDEAPP